MKHINVLICLVFILYFVTSCNTEDDTAPVSDTQWRTCRVAVVLPMGNGLDEHWKRTLNQCAGDLREAFKTQEHGVNLEFEWHDEDSGDMESLAEDLSKRQDVCAVIGGFHSDNAGILASQLCRSHARKPFFTLATTEELVRGYSSAGCLWAMSETDITQCEVLLSKAHAYGAESVGLIADGSSMYGKTFVEWFGFQAKEMGMEVKGIFNYENSAIEQKALEAADSKADYIICTPSDVKDILKIQEAMQQYAVLNGKSPRCLYSDIAYGADVIQALGQYAEGLEGVSIGADPESGFDIRYELTYGTLPTNGEAQIYDAATILGYALYIQTLDESLPLNDAIRKIVAGRDESVSSWTIDRISYFITLLSQGRLPDLRGVSGNLDFDNKVYTNVLSSTYRHYIVYNGGYVTLDYNSSNGSLRTDATLASWNYRSSKLQEFTDSDVDESSYPEMDERWAILIAASSGWMNYRHQADVYNMYQLLKNSGYDDGHIVLIAEDDIASHPNNPSPGIVCTRPDGENVYADVVIDYHPSELSAEDLKSIMCGLRDDRLNQVISADKDDNIFMFWSGHGVPYQMKWTGRDKGFSPECFNDIFVSMEERNIYRKMLCVVEACYSGSVFNTVEGIHGMLAITAADADETSKADVYNCDMEVWMTNRFTSSFMEAATMNPSISLYELYTHAFRSTIGSHVMVYNHQNYGNLHKNSLSEFLQKLH